MTGTTPNPGEQSAVFQYTSFPKIAEQALMLAELGQAPLRSPTVFNFYLPDYVVPGPIAAAGLVAPEFQITDATFAISTANFLFDVVLANNSANTIAADATIVLDLTYEQTLVANPTALLDHLGLLMAGGNLTPALRTRLTTALAALPTGTTPTERAQSAILIIALSSDGAVQK